MTACGATIERLEESLAVSGVLDFDSVPIIWSQSLELISQPNVLHFDLKGVVRSDSAGLALLTAWVRFAKRAGKTIEFYGIPEQMLSAARVSGVEKLLPITSLER